MVRAQGLLGLAAAVLVLGAAIAADAGVVHKRRPLEESEIDGALDPRNPADQPVIAARKAVADEPQSVAARVTLGNAYMARAWIPEALVAYLEATELDPTSSMAWNNVGITEQLQGDDGKALNAFNRAVKLDPRNAQAHYNLGSSLERVHDFDGAVQHYREALRLMPALGDPIANPRSSLASLLLPTRISLYLEASGSRTLPPQRTDGVLNLNQSVLAPSLVVSPSLGNTEQSPDGGRQVTGGEKKPDVPAAPTPAPTPIQVGPGPGAGAGAGAAPGPGVARPTPARTPAVPSPRVRRGGPLPPMPTPPGE